MRLPKKLISFVIVQLRARQTLETPPARQHARVPCILSVRFVRIQHKVRFTTLQLHQQHKCEAQPWLTHRAISIKLLTFSVKKNPLCQQT